MDFSLSLPFIALERKEGSRRMEEEKNNDDNRNEIEEDGVEGAD